MSSESLIVPFTKELQEQIDAFKESMYQSYKAISNEPTPAVDGSGQPIIKKRPDNKDYVISSWMVDRLNKHFPGWSLEMAAPLYFLGSEWVVGQVVLTIIDEKLLAFGINPPIRKFYAADAVRIQYKQGKEHTPENIVDIGDNCQAVITNATKRAINRGTGITDDVYGKRVEEEGAGSVEDILTKGTSIPINEKVSIFNQWLTKNNIGIQDVYAVLGINKLSQITDFQKATQGIIAWVKAGRPKGEKLAAWKKNYDTN